MENELRPETSNSFLISTNEISVQVDSITLMSYMKEIRKKYNRY